MKAFIVFFALIVLASGGPSRGYQQSSYGGYGQRSQGGGGINKGHVFGAVLGAKALALKTALGLSALGTAATVGGIYAASVLGLGGIGAISSIALTFGKRSVGSEDSLATAVHYFNMAMELDSDLCVPLIFCESAVKGHTTKATKFETDVVKMADNAFARVGSSFQPRTLGELVVYATMVGSQSKTQEVCHTEFPQCKNGSTEYIETIYNKV